MSVRRNFTVTWLITFVAQSLIALATAVRVAFIIRSYYRCANVQFGMQRKVVD